jgi:predicted RNase H-like nuclease (RuvC/YqgF family)
MGPTTLAFAADSGDLVSPWLQLIVQTGGFGVLVLLSWQLPKILSALKQWRDESERAHREERSQIREDGKQALKSVLEHCEEGDRRRDVYLQSMQSEVENLQEQIQAMIEKRKSEAERRRQRRRPPQPPDPPKPPQHPPPGGTQP